MARRRDLVICLLLAASCKHHRAKPAGMVVPVTHQAIELDGEWEESDWDKTTARGVFLDGKDQARPFSEVRFLRDDRALYVTLYAADEDIHSDEKFELTLGTLALQITPRGHVTPAVPGLEVAVDLDGVIDQLEPHDEEWVVEMAIPLSAFKATSLAIRAHRCDTPLDGGTRCGTWEGSISIDSE